MPSHLPPPNPRFYAQLLQSWTQTCTSSSLPSSSRWGRRNCRILHGRVLRSGFPLLGNLGNSLVDLYAKSGDVVYARNTLNTLDEWDAKPWNSLLSAHSKLGSTEDVVHGFLSLRRCGVSPDQFTIAIALSSAAGAGRGLCFGRMLHCDALKNGLLRSPSSFCLSSLITVYAKSRSVVDARRVFDESACPDLVAWTAVISGYVRARMEEDALSMFDSMRGRGVLPDRVVFITAIAACVNLGRLKDARNLFAEMPLPNDVAWNSIISGHAQNGCEIEALDLFGEMRRAGGCRAVAPTRSTLGSVLSASANLGLFNEGCQVHSLAVKAGLDSDVFVGSSLVSLYSKCHAIDDAREVFDLLPEKNLVTWNAILGGYMQNGRPESCISLFLEMKEHHGLSHCCDEFTYVSLFNACACLANSNLNLGRQLHSVTIKSGFADSSLFVGNAAVDMYAKCRELSDAERQFNLISCRDIVTWNAMIAGHLHNGCYEEAVQTLRAMLTTEDSFRPDKVSMATVLSACSDLRAANEGRQVHCASIKFGLDTNLYVGSSIVNLYSKIGQMESANRAFIQMPETSVVSRNALIEGWVLNNNPEEALKVFDEMLHDGVEPSDCTIVMILSACSAGSDVGRQLHSHALQSGRLFKDVFLGVALVGMYLRSESGHGESTVDRLFSDVPYSDDVVFWTALISRQIQSEHDAERSAFFFFSRMRSYNVRPDQASFVSILKACAGLAALDDGRQVHCLVIQTGYYSSDECTGGTLVDMYSKCGDVNSSHRVFDEMGSKTDIVTWNSMIVGFAKNGFAEEALTTFGLMKQQSNSKPDAITILGVLAACCHGGGLSSIGRGIFTSMSSRYAIKPRYDHYACIIDMLARGGHMNEAEDFIKRMPFEPDGVIWATLISALCRTPGGTLSSSSVTAAEKLMELEPEISSTYVLLSNLCAAAENWDGFKAVRQVMNDRKVKKSPGRSWIVLGRKTNLFVAGDESHSDAGDIYANLRHLSAATKDGDIALHGYPL